MLASRIDPAHPMRSVPIAHRGLHDAAAGVPENSVAAFDRAVAAGYGIELDVRVLGDGTIVVFHDRELQRLTGEAGDIGRETRDSIRRLRLLGTDEPVPTLEAVLRRIAGRVPLLVEIKSRTATRARIAPGVFRAIEDYRGPLAVQSFDPRSMAWFRKHAPEIARGLILGDFGRKTPLRRTLERGMLAQWLSRPDFLAYDVRSIPSGWVARRREAGLAIFGWVTRSPAEHERMRPFCDNLIFEGYLPDPAQAPLDRP